MDVLRLLELLEDDARISVDDLAAILDSTPDKVKDKIKQLKKKAVIKGSRTTVDWRKVKASKAVAVIQVKVVPQQKTGFDRVCAEISKSRMVTDVFVTSGKYDLMVTVHAENIDEISEFVTEKLAPMKEITGTYTHVILKEFKRDGAVFHELKRKRLPVS